MAMRDRKPSRSPIDAGILSALTCLWARRLPIVVRSMR